MAEDSEAIEKVPRVFISYSWDSEEHKTWVGQLASDLRQRGVDAVIDQWGLRPGNDKFAFMDQEISNCDCVLLICTPQYAKKGNARTGGVGYEATIVTPQVASKPEQTKFVSILRKGSWEESVPVWMQSRIGIDLSSDPIAPGDWQKLLRHIHDAHGVPPPIGPKPSFAKSRNVAESEPHEKSAGGKQRSPELNHPAQTKQSHPQLAESTALC
jgi:hypothetical protein